MKTTRTLAYAAAIAAVFSLGGCDAMFDTGLDVPTGGGGNLSIGYSTPIWGGGYSPWYTGWNSWNYPYWNNGWGAPIVRPIVRPIRPAVRPGTTPPPNWRPPTNNGGNWRPPTGGGSGNGITLTPVPSLPTPPASTGTPDLPVAPVRPGRH